MMPPNSSDNRRERTTQPEPARGKPSSPDSTGQTARAGDTVSTSIAALGLSEAELTIPSSARMYDYYLGGHHNLAVDRAAADTASRIFPGFPLAMQANRAFLRRAVTFLGEQGVERFLDIGSGIPTVGNVHQIAQTANPAARVVYVDIDPVAVAQSAALLQGNERATVLHGDVRKPEEILRQAAVRDLLGAGEPVALIMAFLLHFVADDAEAVHAVRTLVEALPLGSYLVLSAGTIPQSDKDLLEQVVALYSGTSQPVKPRSREEILRYFAGLELVEPGLVYVPQWRPEEQDDLLLDQPERSIGFAGVARKAR